jgi:RNA polymerase sigma factor (sigma-70 family)
MPDTSHTLLDRLVQGGDPESWQLLVDLYSPLLRTWLLRYDVSPADCDDLIQEVLLVVVRELPAFRHNRRTGAFRAWLRQIMVHRLRNAWRLRDREAHAGQREGMSRRLDELADDGGAASEIWDREHDQFVIHKLFDLVEPRFERTTWLAFRRLTLDDQDARQVAAELGLSLNAVFTAKSRVLRELRRLGQDLIDEQRDSAERRD